MSDSQRDSKQDQKYDKQAIEAMRQENIGRLFLRAHRAFSASSVIKLRERGHVGLTLAHTALLSNLDTRGTRITTLAERAGMTKQSMGQLVVDLEERGYVVRSTDPKDKRAIIVNFTDAGWRFLEDAYMLKLEIEAEYSAILGESGFGELRGLLVKLLDSIERIQSDEDAE